MFDNKEGGNELGLDGRDMKWGKTYKTVGKYDNIQDLFRNEILELSKTNKIILIYPVPEVGLDPNTKIFVNRKNKFSTKSNIENLSFVTTSYKVYKERTQSSFELLDSIKNTNLHRVYPHTLFCNTTFMDRCMTHDNESIFYVDDDHTSKKGAEMINDLIMKKIIKIKLN